MSNHKNEPQSFPPVPGYRSLVPENLDELKDLSGDRFCVKLNDIAICQIMDDKRLTPCWKWFGKLEKAARLAVAQRNFGLVPKVNENPKQYLALYELSQLAANIQRNIISQTILNKNHPFTKDLLFEPNGREWS